MGDGPDGIKSNCVKNADCKPNDEASRVTRDSSGCNANNDPCHKNGGKVEGKDFANDAHEAIAHDKIDCLTRHDGGHSDPHVKVCIADGSKGECGGGDLKRRCSNEERSDYDLKGDGVNDGGRQVEGERNDCKGDNSQPQEKEGDIASFRKLHSDVVEKLTSLCEQWEERPTTSTIPDDRKEEGEHKRG